MMFLMSSDMEPSGLRMNSRALSSRYTFTGTLISTPPALRRLCFSDAAVDSDRSVALHRIGDMGINVQRGSCGYMTDDGG